MLQVMSVYGVAANSAHQYAPSGIDIPGGDWLVQKITPIDHDDMIKHGEKMYTVPMTWIQTPPLRLIQVELLLLL